MRKVVTTIQVVKICKVAPSTAAKWADRSRPEGYRIPGGRDRHVTREQLIRFLEEHGLPPGESDGEAGA
jgi:transposase